MLGGTIGIVGLIFVAIMAAVAYHFFKTVLTLVYSCISFVTIFVIIGIIMNVYYTDLSAVEFIDILFGIRDEKVGDVMMIPIKGWIAGFEGSGVGNFFQGLKEWSIEKIIEWIKSLIGWGD